MDIHQKVSHTQYEDMFMIQYIWISQA